LVTFCFLDQDQKARIQAVFSGAGAVRSGGIEYAKKKNNEGREDGTFRSMEDLWPLVA
jgi:hypothetical protein